MVLTKKKMEAVVKGNKVMAQL